MSVNKYLRDWDQTRDSVTTRRRFLWQSAIAAVATLAPWSFSQTTQRDAGRVAPTLDPDSLARFVDPLPFPVVAQPQGDRAVPGKPGERAPFYRVSMRAIASKLHRDLPPTSLWSYGDSVPGVMFDTQSGQGLFVEWVNELPLNHLLPIDYLVHGAERGTPEVRSVVHLHGGKTPPESSGYPEYWYVPGQSRTCYYPNQQEAAQLWYHDHAIGTTRLNVYAGLFGLFVVRDQAERQLQLPNGKYEVPLVLFDRHLRQDGQLSYPHSWMPEIMGEVPLVNGKIFPYLEVEPRKYRFRVLNAANSRLFRLSLPHGVVVHQIGTDQGLLPAPVLVTQVQLAPGERADLVVDFAPHRGTRILLSDDAFTLMEFRVSTSPVSDPSGLPTTLRRVPHITRSSSVKTRFFTLDEVKQPTDGSVRLLLNKTSWDMPISEKPVLGTTEIWELANLTEKLHPIHLHQFRFQILDHRFFDASEYMESGKVHYGKNPPTLPSLNERGWKDTVRVNASTVTRIIIPFQGYSGRYVWNCQNLEHEDNEMMRPYEVLGVGS